MRANLRHGLRRATRYMLADEVRVIQTVRATSGRHCNTKAATGLGQLDIKSTNGKVIW